MDNETTGLRSAGCCSAGAMTSWLRIPHRPCVHLLGKTLETSSLRRLTSELIREAVESTPQATLQGHVGRVTIDAMRDEDFGDEKILVKYMVDINLCGSQFCSELAIGQRGWFEGEFNGWSRRDYAMMIDVSLNNSHKVQGRADILPAQICGRVDTGCWCEILALICLPYNTTAELNLTLLHVFVPESPRLYD
ncbi:hypothetical protein PSTT_12976 [Puccinia striiformis]|uniref:Uncharacterized protein n=1 Tax=Puccinia striiformis TaxID=27350 RepID=A0A2S4UUA7_9BASI|nr:hypothetical protein PSTT_12976 [Puccinia striiformis]